MNVKKGKQKNVLHSFPVDLKTFIAIGYSIIITLKGKLVI
jgi:hypothetical protein